MFPVTRLWRFFEHPIASSVTPRKKMSGRYRSFGSCYPYLQQFVNWWRHFVHETRYGFILLPHQIAHSIRVKIRTRCFSRVHCSKHGITNLSLIVINILFMVFEFISLSIMHMGPINGLTYRAMYRDSAIFWSWLLITAFPFISQYRPSYQHSKYYLPVLGFIETSKRMNFNAPNAVALQKETTYRASRPVQICWETVPSVCSHESSVPCCFITVLYDPIYFCSSGFILILSASSESYVKCTLKSSTTQ